MKQREVKIGLAVLAVTLVGFLAAGMTADEILDRVDEAADLVAEGSLVATIRFENVYGDGTTASNRFGSLAKPNASLIYFIEPADVEGSILLTQQETDADSSRIFLYLPLLGIPKELVSDEERERSFAGSSLSYEDIGGSDERAEYDAVLLREEEIMVGDQTRDTYVIESTAKSNVETDTPRTVLWIDAADYVMLRLEAYNDLGNLASTMEALALGEFEDRVTADRMLATDVLNDSSTTITFLTRHRPDKEISDETFSVDNLASFDPSAWGFRDQQADEPTD